MIQAPLWEAAVSSSYSFSHAAPFSVQCHLLQGALHDTPPKVTPSLLLSLWFISLMFPMWSLKHVVSSGKLGKCHLKKKKVLVLELQKTTVNILVYFLLVGHLCKDISLPTCHFILLVSLTLILRLADHPILTSQLMAFRMCIIRQPLEIHLFQTGFLLLLTVTWGHCQLEKTLH